MRNKLSDVGALRAMLREKFPGTVVETAEKEVEIIHNKRIENFQKVTGVRCLDAAGVARGELVEVVGSNGGGLVVDGLLVFLAEQGRVLMLIDGADRFDPDSAGDALCRWVLWARCERVEQALKVADLILRDGNLRDVLLDLEGCAAKELRKVAASTWYRLRGLAEAGGALFIVMTSEPLVGCADLRVEVSLDLEERGFAGACDGVLRSELVDALEGRVLRGRRRPKAGEEEGSERRLEA